jgi:hypothetical protein
MGCLNAACIMGFGMKRVPEHPLIAGWRYAAGQKDLNLAD